MILKRAGQIGTMIFFIIFIFSSSLCAEIVYPQIIVAIDNISVSSGDIIPSAPLLEATLFTPADGPPIDIESLELKIDDAIIPLNKVRYVPISPSSYVIRYEIPKLSAEYGHSISIQIKDRRNHTATWQANDLIVDGGEVKIAGIPKATPSTIRPFVNSGTYIAYRLTRAAHVTIYVYDGNGGLVWQKKCRVDAEGGKMGYNSVFWAGVNSENHVLAAGIYFYRIMAETGVGAKIIGRGRVTILETMMRASLLHG